MAKFSMNKKEKSVGTEVKTAIMTGVSYMLPLIIAGAVIMGIARIGASFYGIDNIWDGSHAEAANALVRLFHAFDGFGGLALSLMLPVVAGYIAFSIADKPGIAPGMVAGLLAKEMGTGFLGALAAGFIAGYIVKLLVTKVKLPKSVASAGPIFIIPVGGTLLACLVMMYIIGDPLAAMNRGLENWLLSMSDGNKIVLAAVVGGWSALTSVAYQQGGGNDSDGDARIRDLRPEHRRSGCHYYSAYRYWCSDSYLEATLPTFPSRCR